MLLTRHARGLPGKDRSHLLDLMISLPNVLLIYTQRIDLIPSVLVEDCVISWSRLLHHSQKVEQVFSNREPLAADQDPIFLQRFRLVPGVRQTHIARCRCRMRYRAFNMSGLRELWNKMHKAERSDGVIEGVVMERN
jgi:hypothetical protein